MNFERHISPEDRDNCWRSASILAKSRRRALITPEERLARQEARERRARSYYPDLPIHEALDRLADDDAERAT